MHLLLIVVLNLVKILILLQTLALETNIFKSQKNGFKKYGVCIVEKTKGHPTRLCQQSLRFEVKPGDWNSNRTWDDCKNDRERHELSGNRHGDGDIGMLGQHIYSKTLKISIQQNWLLVNFIKVKVM